MARNIEIKARIEDLSAMQARVATLADRGPIEIRQDDTFFGCPHGRLKLREFTVSAGELIFYQRADAAGPKESFYVRSPTADPAGLREALSLAHGIVGRVLKQRTLYLIGRTRVHVDRVQQLGEFLELEVVLDETEPAQLGLNEAAALMRQLDLDPRALVAGAYVDLLSVLSA